MDDLLNIDVKEIDDLNDKCLSSEWNLGVLEAQSLWFRIKRFHDMFLRGLNPSPVTEEECFEVARSMKCEFENKSPSFWREEVQLITHRTKSLIAHSEDVIDQLTVKISSQDPASHSSMVLKSESDKLKEEIGSMKENVIPRMWSPSYEVNVMQTQLMKLVRDQPAEVKDSFWKEHLSEFSNHVKRRCCDSKPVVNLEKHRTTLKTENSLSLPPEIMTIIFLHLDLESCVNLRQVNSDWYTSFQALEHIWHQKVSERNPWFTPEDLNTQKWGVCALVAGYRLRWKRAESLEQVVEAGIFSGRNTRSNTKTLVYRRCQSEEKLPSNFERLFEKGDFEKRPHILSKSPTTLEISHNGLGVTFQPQNRQMLEKSEPIAFHNGILWWRLFVADGILVPTFVDLDTPGKLLCRPERSIQCGSSSLPQGNKQRGLSHLLFAPYLLVDLETGLRTSLQSRADMRPSITGVVPGFVDGQFQVRWIRDGPLDFNR